MSDSFSYGDQVEFLVFGNTWKKGQVFAVLNNDKVVVYAEGLVIGTDLYECKLEDVRKAG